MNDLKKLFESFASLRVGVIGDVMLDTYMWGKVDRISPEAPVPVVTLDHKEYRIGGAGNVALNCCSLGANVSILSVTGNDDDGVSLENLFRKNNIDTGGLVKSDTRITTSKTRIIARNQQMLRVDAEITNDLDAVDQLALLDRVKNFIATQKPAILIFEDYNKGVLTPALIAATIDLCKKEGILTAVDPKRKNFFAYKNVDIFKPNLKEVKEALNLLFDDPTEKILNDIHKELNKNMGHQISFITLSEKGVFFQNGSDWSIIPSHLRNVADVSGAGDTVIAVASMVYAVTRDISLMAEVANIAGGLVCEQVGTVPIDREKLLQECEMLLLS